MNQWQKDVLAFHEGTGSTIGDTLELRDRELRAKLILEEALETVTALGFEPIVYYDPPRTKPEVMMRDAHKPDLIEVLDGLCDLIYVALGTAVAAGIDLEPFWTEVHRSNMAKIDPEGYKRQDGKILKPAGWTPPDLEKILIREQAKRDEWFRLEESWREHGGEA